jgi:hypothetical protein
VATVSFFTLNLVGFLIFRSTSLEQIGNMLVALGNFSAPGTIPAMAAQLMLLAGPVLLIDWMEFRGNGEELVTQLPVFGQAVAYATALVMFFTIGEYDGASFIYFQF